ncbi:hypothetical protein ACWF0M_11715 [Kribbella sp. NPDC055110]
MGFGKKEPKQTRKEKKDAKAVDELKGKMANGGVMSGRKAARAVRAINNGRG